MIQRKLAISNVWRDAEVKGTVGLELARLTPGLEPWSIAAHRHAVASGQNVLLQFRDGRELVRHSAIEAEELLKGDLGLIAHW